MSIKIRVARALLRDSRKAGDEGIRVLLDIQQPESGEVLWPEFVVHEGKAYRNTSVTLWGARVYSDINAHPSRPSEKEWEELSKGS